MGLRGMMVKNVEIFELPCYADNYGYLVAIETVDTIPFEVERVYYIFDVEQGVRRGFHSHFDLQQTLVCVHGSVKILVEDGTESEEVLLDDPRKALYIGPMVWREMFDFSEDAVLLVLASRHYDLADYERNHEAFLVQATDYFSGKAEK